MRKIATTDVTLKQLSEDRKVSLLFREKTTISQCADLLGVDAVEVAPIKNLREDTIVYKTISQNIKNASVVIPVGFNTDDVSNAWECVKDAKSPRLQIELPVSTVQMEYTYHIKAEKMLQKIEALVKKAKELCKDVEFSALDATRADENFLLSAVRTAEECGANIITLCDLKGVSLPNEIEALVKKVKKEISCPLYVQLSDNIHMALACAISAISAGADGIKCALDGKDALLAGQLSDAIEACKGQLDATIGIDATRVHASIESITQKINHENYESADEISDKKKILLDSESSLSDVCAAAKTLGYELSDEDNGKVHKALLKICEKKGSIGRKELEALIASNAMQAPSTYHFENYTTTCGSLQSAMSQITLKCNDEFLQGVSTGDGPIDSVFRAIEQSIGYHYELDDFQIQAVTDGKEALGSAIVKLRNNGKLYSGNGISTDIVAASIRAYINALNKIVYEEEQG